MEPDDEEKTWATGALRTSFKRALESLSRDFSRLATGIEVPRPKKASARRKAAEAKIQRRNSGEDTR